MPLDPVLLAAARSAARALHEAETALEPLREAYRATLRDLHAGGASLREMAAALGLSHQRMHQLVGNEGASLPIRKEPRDTAPLSAGEPCWLCGEAGTGPVCSPCRGAGRALLAGVGEGRDRGMRLLRRHQRPTCRGCGRHPEAGEVFLAGPAGAVCQGCLGRDPPTTPSPSGPR